MATRKHVLGRAAAAALSTAIVPVTALAQTPSFAHSPPPNSSDVINGTIASINGKYTITVHDDRGFIDDVHLHQGTIINPTGLTLAPGMRVTIFGYNAGSWFEANEIDTPVPLRSETGTGVYRPRLVVSGLPVWLRAVVCLSGARRRRRAPAVPPGARCPASHPGGRRSPLSRPLALRRCERAA